MYGRKSVARVCLSATETPKIGSKLVLRVTWLMKSLCHQFFDLPLRGRAADRGHAGFPTGSDLYVRRQAACIDEALGIGDRPFVERRDANRQCVDEAVEFDVGQRSVHITIGFGQIAPDIM